MAMVTELNLLQQIVVGGEQIQVFKWQLNPSRDAPDTPSTVPVPGSNTQPRSA